jgi:NADPH-dependent 2,4-dienoyl-CoA reductase/sulfur reductase-like enzyme
MTEAEKTDSSNKEVALTKPRVVIVGGGFGGLCAARGLLGAPFSVTLIDKRNYHLFRPILYQVATGLLSADQISRPLRSILSRQANVEVLMDEVSGVDTDKRLVRLKQHSISYEPYNDFISEGGKIWDRIKGVAEANNCVPNMLRILRAARQG